MVRPTLKLIRIAAVALLLSAFLAFGTSCSVNQSKASRIDRANQLMNSRDYVGATQMLEDEHQADPGNESVSLLLAQAYLGQAGLEMFDLVTATLAEQKSVTDSDLAFEPKCSASKVDKVASYDIRCLLFRIMKALPHADDPNILKAQALLRGSFADPAKTSADVNFLAAFVELSSALMRVKAWLGPDLIGGKSGFTYSDTKFSTGVHHIKRFFEEIQFGFLRLRYSYGKLSRYVVSLDGKPLIQVGSARLVFSQDIGMPAILRFAGQILTENADSIDNELSATAGQLMSQLGRALMRYLQQIDHTDFNSSAAEDLIVYWRFDRAINQLLELLLDAPKAGRHIDLFAQILRNPPPLIRSLGEAASESWSEEDPTPLNLYFAKTGDAWNELGNLISDWSDWLEHGLTREQRELLLKFLLDRRLHDPHLMALPDDLSSNNMRALQADLNAGALGALEEFLKEGGIQAFQLGEKQIPTGYALIRRTRAWIRHYLWGENSQ